jgi:thiol-disulfide isomerase/thioredoxin
MVGMKPRLLVWLTLLALAPLPAHAFNFAPTEPKPAPELSFLDGQGNALSLEDFRGQVVVLNLWATWCAPCRREMPGLDRLQAMLGEDGLAVVPLSLDRGEVGQIETFYEEVGLPTLGIYHDPKAAAGRAFGASGLPTTIVIDREGREIGRLLGPAEWDSEEAVTLIRAVLAE